MNNDMIWDLRTVLGGSDATCEIEDFITTWYTRFEFFTHALTDRSKLQDQILLWQELEQTLDDLAHYAICRISQNTQDTEASILESKALAMKADLQAKLDLLDSNLSKTPDDEIDKLLQDARLFPIRFAVLERRRLSQEKLTQSIEEVVSNLSACGYHSWNSMYTALVSKMQVTYKEAVTGKTQSLPWSQAYNILASPSREERREIFLSWENSCNDQKLLFAHILNNIAGYRIALYNARGWSSHNHEALSKNRIQQKTIDAMWTSIDISKAPFIKFLNTKAHMLGRKNTSWYDLESPFGNENDIYSYHDALELIKTHFNNFSPQLLSFTEYAVKNSWIDAENRTGKATGGFCVPFYGTKESRIFMTYSNTFQNALTLAHELGHAFHNKVLSSNPRLSQEYPMCLAECASTFAEQIIADGILDNNSSIQNRLKSYHNRALRSCVFLMNIHSRYIFEEIFYNERRRGFVSADRLCEITIESQKKAYSGSLDVYHKYFWMTKLHFYFTEYPGYNFPYTVGYLLSLALYDKAQMNPDIKENIFIDFLKDTSQMTVEDIITKHFQKNPQTTEFWLYALSIAQKDVDSFLHLHSLNTNTIN